MLNTAYSSFCEKRSYRSKHGNHYLLFLIKTITACMQFLFYQPNLNYLATIVLASTNVTHESFMLLNFFYHFWNFQTYFYNSIKTTCSGKYKTTIQFFTNLRHQCLWFASADSIVASTKTCTNLPIQTHGKSSWPFLSGLSILQVVRLLIRLEGPNDYRWVPLVLTNVLMGFLCNLLDSGRQE